MMHSNPNEKGIFNQKNVIEKVNLYLKAKGDKPIGQGSLGYCHGLALLWIIKMSTREEDWFYNLIHKIALFSKDTLNSIIRTTAKDKLFVSDFDKFINHIEWAHRSERYANVSQTDIDKILDLPSRIYDIERLNQSGLIDHLKLVFSKSDFAVVSGQSDRYAHSIGVFFRDNEYYLYDGNYTEGRAKSFSTLTLLAQEIYARLNVALRSVGAALRFYEFFYSPSLKTLSVKEEFKAEKVEEKHVEVQVLKEIKNESKPVKQSEQKEEKLVAATKPDKKDEAPVSKPSNSLFKYHHKDHNKRIITAVDHTGKTIMFLR